MTGAFNGIYQGKTVLLTGHTGFKGGWLAWWLVRLGARVVGYALPAPAGPSFFAATDLDRAVAHVEADIRDGARLQAVMSEHRPDFVFHLAAQALVRASYRAPVETFEVNAMGTAHVLEAVRHCPSVRAVVVVTTDKCYENREWVYAYRENDPLGGHDPYSASKAAAELVTASFRSSYFPPERGVGVATARAGNVIGGGDWAEDRLVPDCVRSLASGEPITVRHPHAIRPWQHVLDPLAGYLSLGERLAEDPARFSEGWNFGPGGNSHVTVGEVVAQAVQAWGAGTWTQEPQPAAAMHEAHCLKLDVAKAAALLGWAPVMDFSAAMGATMAWYVAQHQDAHFDARAFTLAQIGAFEARLARTGTGRAGAAPSTEEER